jgi:pimeloyl-ACP methyl ester carboxylesterase
MVLQVAAGEPRVAAVVSQTPNADGPAATRNALGYQRKGALLRVMARGIADAVGGAFGRSPRLLPLTGAPGSVALLTTPDVADGDVALDPDGAYAGWPQVVAARAALTVGRYRPGRFAPEITCPLLVVVADDDRTALAGPGIEVAERAPAGELVRVPGNHYAPFLAAHEQVVTAELAFLDRHLLRMTPVA